MDCRRTRIARRCRPGTLGAVAWGPVVVIEKRRYRLSTERIAIVGMACVTRTPSPEELWENVLAGRRAFRRLPDERMNRPTTSRPTRTRRTASTAAKAAVLRDYEFDRVAYQVAGSTYRSTDLTHWLALDVAAQALADAGFPDGEGLPRERTGVVVGNTLTGEFSRANLLRLRWPYVRRTRRRGAARARAGTTTQLGDVPRRPRAALQGAVPGRSTRTPSPAACPTPSPAGSATTSTSSGGGYTVDGACSSSLLSVATACKALVDGDLDVAVAGGVDLSHRPVRADRLRQDRRAGHRRDARLRPRLQRLLARRGLRHGRADARGGRASRAACGIYAVDRRLGRLLRRQGRHHPARGRRPPAGAAAAPTSGPASASTPCRYFEGHGTGTAVGDATELDGAVTGAGRAADPTRRPAAIGSVKGNIGHTKAAAGVAGLIKATMAVHHQVHPADHRLRRPAPDARPATAPALRVLRAAEPWPADAPGAGRRHRDGLRRHQHPHRRWSTADRRAAPPPSGRDAARWSRPAGRRAAAARRATAAATCATGSTELADVRAAAVLRASSADLAATLHRRAAPAGRYRAAVVAAIAGGRRAAARPAARRAGRRRDRGCLAADGGASSATSAAAPGSASCSPARAPAAAPTAARCAGGSPRSTSVYAGAGAADRRRPGGHRGRPAAHRHRLAGRPARAADARHRGRRSRSGTASAS